jgi:DNA-binding response OmpR family regulator
MKVMVADDDASVRESLGKVLREAGYDVVLAKDGGEAVERFNAHEIDLLLLDLSLPIRDGWDAYERITSKAPELPIIIITGKANQHDIAVAAGVGALMEKPLDVAELLQAMRQLLAEPKEARLRRLCGYSQNLRHIPPASNPPIQSSSKRSSTPFRRWTSAHNIGGKGLTIRRAGNLIFYCLKKKRLSLRAAFDTRGWGSSGIFMVSQPVFSFSTLLSAK